MGVFPWTYSTPNLSTVFNSVFVNSDYTAFGVGTYGTIAKSTDFANTWIQDTIFTYTNLTQTFQSVFFISPSTGYVGNEIGYLLKTTNAGATWIAILVLHYPEPPYGIRSIFFLPNYTNIGYIAQQLGRIQRTNNAGANWYVEGTPTEQNLNSIYFLDSLNGYAAGDLGCCS